MDEDDALTSTDIAAFTATLTLAVAEHELVVPVTE